MISYIVNGEVGYSVRTKLNSVIDVANVAVPEAATDGNLYARQNAAWAAIPKITVSSTAPSSPAVNDVWIDTA